MEAALASNPYAKAAVEMALWDLMGRQLGVPLHRLLGGGPPAKVPIKYVIGILDEARAAEEARWALEAGFSHLKVKVGKDLEGDLRRVHAVIEAAPGTRVGVDANEGWDFPTALRALVELEDLGVSFLEQPISRAHEAGLADLARRSSVPVVLHESLFTARDAVTAAERRLGHIWAVTPSAHGGLLTTLDILALARVQGIPCLVGSTVELGVATAFLAQIAASDRNITDCPVPSDIIGPLYHSDDVVAAPPLIESGFVHAPVGPGLGVDLDDERVRKYLVHAA
jgi:muconate cycloisomerase